MTPYIILLAAAMLLGFFLCELRPGRKQDIIFLLVTSVALIWMSTVRASTVGVDYQPYLNFFQRVAEGGTEFVFSEANPWRIEIGYSLLNYVISLFGQSQTAFALGIAIVSIGLTAVFLYKYSPSIWVSMSVFIGFGFFSYTLCTLRNQIGICIFMFALPFLQKKKLLPYALIVLLCATFHKSMLVLLPLYFIAWLPLNWKLLSAYSGATLLFIIFSEPIMTFITKYVYTNYQVGSYYMQGRDFRTGFVPIAVFGALYLLKNKLLERNPANLPLLNLMMYTALLYCMTFKHFVFQRFGQMILPVCLLLLPELLRALRPAQEKLDGLALAKKAVQTANGGAKKQALAKYSALATAIHDERAMYYAALGFILFACWLYQLFLLTANRLDLVPYVTQAQADALAAAMNPLT